MARSLILTIIGEDQPGLVERLSRTIAAHEGNWLESRMAHLAGKFAGILRVSVPPGKAEALMSDLAGLEARGLRVVSEPSEAEPERFQAVRLELVGTDHPGIVRDISEALARRRVNVEELETECRPAPMSGQMIFQAKARLHVPAEVSMEDLRLDLEAVASDLMVDLVLGEVATST